MPVASPVPYWQSDCGRAILYLGECEKILPRLSESMFHAVVTDPPYNLSFMDSEWDKIGDGRAFQNWFLTCAQAILHVAKPGAHILSFGGTRMCHRMACAIEDAGFEMRDMVMWMYGSGMPKNRLNIGKTIDKTLGVERETITKEEYARTKGEFGASVSCVGNSRAGDGTVYGLGQRGEFTSREPVTDTAKQWNGWGTTLKPAVEPIIVARKPVVGMTTDNILEHGCGALNVDSCKVNGRWPTNVIHDGSAEVIQGLPEDAVRYFYTPKADHTDRAHGAETKHPTVKPLDLMRYLVRLVCAKGGTVLDPFTGTASTGCAAIEEGMFFVGVEKSKEYADIAVDRLKEMLGVHPRVERLVTGKRIVKDTPPPPQVLR